MKDPQSLAKNKIHELLASVHRSLSNHPSVFTHSRDLSSQEQQLVSNLRSYPTIKDNLVSLLAIESLSIQITRSSESVEELMGRLTRALESMNQLGDLLHQNRDDKTQMYLEAYNSFGKCLRAAQKLYPNSNHIKEQNLLIDKKLIQKQQGSTVANLRLQNQELKKKLQQNDEHLVSMEIKLTKLLREHEEDQRQQRYQQGQSADKMHLQDEVTFRDQEIDRMNQQFSFQLHKYNTVFEVMKRELEEMKGYQNIDLIEQIEMLETEIVRLREEKERDQIIIRQLRTDNMIFSGDVLGSPAHKKRCFTPRYDF